jgi:hypothetical protein
MCSSAMPSTRRTASSAPPTSSSRSIAARLLSPTQPRQALHSLGTLHSLAALHPWHRITAHHTVHHYLVHGTAVCRPGVLDVPERGQRRRSGYLQARSDGARVRQHCLQRGDPARQHVICMVCAWYMWSHSEAVPSRRLDNPSPTVPFNTQARRHLRTHQDAVWVPPFAGCRAVREERVTPDARTVGVDMAPSTCADAVSSVQRPVFFSSRWGGGAAHTKLDREIISIVPY